MVGQECTCFSQPQYIRHIIPRTLYAWVGHVMMAWVLMVESICVWLCYLFIWYLFLLWHMYIVIQK